MQRSIIIMAKVPRAGEVKTRLQPALAPEQCQTLAAAFLADAIYKTQNLCSRLIIAFAPASEKSYFARFDFENTILIEQRGADLGEKMSNAFEFALRQNSETSVVMIGTDSPTFPDEYIERAFEFFETGADTVVGESDDGGFYLIGLRKVYPQLFENVEWSSPHVFEQTLRNGAALNLDLKMISAWYDVDTPNDLRRLRDEISRDETAQKIAPQTFQWLIEHSRIFDSSSNF